MTRNDSTENINPPNLHLADVKIFYQGATHLSLQVQRVVVALAAK